MRDRLRRLSSAVDEAQTYLSTLRGEQADLRQAIGRLRERVEEVKMAEQECRRIEIDVRTRIAKPVLDEAEDAAASLRLQLDALERLRMEGLWPRLAELFQEVEQGCADAIERARGRRAAAEALLDEREDLRGRLESYRAMASRYGHAEDLALANQYEDTHRLLWTAPCDLHEASASLARYQAAVIERTEPRRPREEPDPGVEAPP
jgi:hypothetical protein